MSPRRPGRWIPIIVLALGSLSLTLVLSTRWLDSHLIQRDEKLLHAVEGIGNSVASAHLWLEEYLSGDEVELAKIQANFDRAERLSESLIHAESKSEFLRPHDEELARMERQLRDRLIEFRRMAERRQAGHVRGEPVGVGSSQDIAYDGMFEAVLGDASSLATALEQRLERSRERAALLFRAIVGSWIVIVALAAVALWLFDKRRAAIEAELRDSRERLLQSQKMEAVGRLAGGIAHDINNYLGAIRAHADLIGLKLRRDDGLQPRVDSIVNVVDKASGLIDRLLAFTRRQAVQPRVIDVNELLREGKESVMHRVLGDAVSLEIRLAESVWPVEIDPVQLEQVVVNLLVNARDAMTDGGAIVLRTENVEIDADHAMARRVPRLGRYVALSVADTGHGIPQRIREQIFEPYFTTKDRAGSSGLGLATVLGIVQNAGGEIHVESAEGHGSTFTVLLPRTERAAETKAPRAPVAAKARVPGQLSILLVEDNADMRQTVTEILETVGYDVTAAGEPRAALELFERRSGAFDVVISDVVLPGMNGKRMADRMRERSPELKVLFISGYAEDLVPEEGSPEKREALLRKPFSMDQLLDAIDLLREGASSTS